MRLNGAFDHSHSLLINVEAEFKQVSCFSSSSLFSRQVVFAGVERSEKVVEVNVGADRLKRFLPVGR